MNCAASRAGTAVLPTISFRLRGERFKRLDGQTLAVVNATCAAFGRQSECSQFQGNEWGEPRVSG